MKLLNLTKNTANRLVLLTSSTRYFHILSSSVKILSLTHSKPCFLVNNGQICKINRRFFADFPEHNIIKLPNLSPTMETGTVISWAKTEGDQVSEGDLLAEIETDKATMSLDASDEGFIAKILIPAGSKDIPVGTPLCVVVADQGLVAAFKEFSANDAAGSGPLKKKPEPVAAPAAPPVASTATAPVAQPVYAPAVTRSSGQRIFASPLARRLAKERGIDLASLGIGSGLLGMIVSNDLANAKAGSMLIRPQFARSADSVQDIPVSNMRAVIAKRLLESKRTIPHYYLTVDVNLNGANSLRKSINEKLKDKKISLNDIIIKAVSSACLKVPECNSSWMGETIKQYNVVDVSVAVATPNGLITPIVKDAHLKKLTDISMDVKELASRARENKLQPHEFQGGTFTISNLGMFGISNFSAIINPPQACLLAVGGTRKQVLAGKAGGDSLVQVADVMSVTLCCDHRVVDGAIGARWLAEFKQAIEEPALMLM